ncbi:hypothetical protein WA026_001609 [Henosepilachna vigintioctopunctata]|uniref:Ankyrin repeat protein n=1 Tax=Henosepilachna vigintioctopunctata TaxID=420089 RepID=A0AAW1ULP0_9CUCU
MKYEVEQGGEIDFVDSQGNNSLHLVCCEAYYTPHFIAYLLEFSSNINAQNNNLQTPLHRFISNSHKDTALFRLFLEKGADPNIPDKCGNTALHYLARSRAHKTTYFITFVEILIEFKANLNAQNKYGETPLHVAIRKGTVGFIPILLNHGASVFIENKKNLTPIDTAYAKRIDHKVVFMEIAKHVIILNNSNVHIKKDILDKILCFESLKTFDEECKNEISNMKDIEVGETNLTLCTILKSSTRTFAKYLRNPDVMYSFQNNICQYSIIFENRLNKHFEESLERKEAEEKAFPIYMDIFRILPEICVNHVIMYLGNDDLNRIK